jgi:hypothetical protein
LKAQYFQGQVRLFQQGLALSGVLGPDQGFQQVVEVPLDAFAQHEAVIAGEPARVMEGPQDQVVGLGEDDQFFLFPTGRQYNSLYCSEQMHKPHFHFPTA